MIHNKSILTHISEQDPKTQFSEEWSPHLEIPVTVCMDVLELENQPHVWSCMIMLSLPAGKLFFHDSSSAWWY